MNDSIDIEDRVDRYILCQMSETERAAFEQDLLVNDALKEEYLAQKFIADSVQRVALRNFLEVKSSQLSRRKISTLSGVINSAIGHFKEYMYQPRRILVTASIAASFIVAVVGTIDYTNKSSDMVELSAQYYSQTLSPVLRGENEIDVLLIESYNRIGENNIEDAEDCLEKAFKLIESEIVGLDDSEEGRYLANILKSQKQDAEWYSAVIEMKKGHLIRAKKQLKTISGSDSQYADEAKQILQTLFN